MRRWLVALVLLAGAPATLAHPPDPGAPPPGLLAHALAVDARAPAIDAVAASGGRWRLAGALAHGPAVLVFYRGDW